MLLAGKNSSEHQEGKSLEEVRAGSMGWDFARAVSFEGCKAPCQFLRAEGIFCVDDSETPGDHMVRIYDAERAKFHGVGLTSRIGTVNVKIV